MDSDNNASLWGSDDLMFDGEGGHRAHHPFSFFHGHPSPIFSPMPPEYSAILESMEVGWGESGGELWQEDQVQGGGGGCEGEQAGGELGGAIKQPGAVITGGGCKNLLTERNRRMRLNQQLLALRLIVPCISKQKKSSNLMTFGDERVITGLGKNYHVVHHLQMDKRSILIDAAEYLQGIHCKIEMLEKEMSEGELTSLNDPNLSLSSSEVPEHNSRSSTIPYKILEIDIEKINDRLFSIKVIFERAKGIQAQIQRVTESLGFDISNTTIHPVDQHKMLSTSFMHVRKQKQLTEESLKKRIIEASLNCGIMVEIDD